jgi:hypothetical protein
MYFDLLESKISEHSVLPENSYNMDEKGFMCQDVGPHPPRHAAKKDSMINEH